MDIIMFYDMIRMIVPKYRLCSDSC